MPRGPVLREPQAVGGEEEAETLLVWALWWGIARRYNQTYNSHPSGKWVFKDPDAYALEMEWFAQSIMREWSGCLLSWLPLPPVERPPGCPEPAKTVHPDDFGCISWLGKLDTSWRVYKRIYALCGQFHFSGDVDQYAELRRCDVKNPQKQARYPYVAFRQIPSHLAKRRVVGPTRPRGPPSVAVDGHEPNGIYGISRESPEPFSKDEDDRKWAVIMAVDAQKKKEYEDMMATPFKRLYFYRQDPDTLGDLQSESSSQPQSNHQEGFSENPSIPPQGF